MTKEEIQGLIAESNKPLIDRALKGDAVVEASRIMKPLAMRESAKQLAIDNVIERGLPVAADGRTLDSQKFGELLTAEARRVAAALGESVEVGLTGGELSLAGEHVEALSPKKLLKEAKRRAELEQFQMQESASIFESIGMPKKAAELAAKGRAA